VLALQDRSATPTEPRSEFHAAGTLGAIEIIAETSIEAVRKLAAYRCGT
jgi:hypothetical protein